MTKFSHSKKQLNWRISLIFTAQAATFFVANTAFGQTAPVDTVLQPITIVAPKSGKEAQVTGFGDIPAQRQPITTTVIDSDTINLVGARRLADVIKLDASTSDAYNAIGYWDYATVRGFVLDNKFNYRREGLPISAETFIPLDNKERVEILKGTSGIQAGTSAPGGLINYAIKRPTSQPLRAIKLEASSAGSVLAAADFGGRFGQNAVWGYRLNLATEKLKTATPGTTGQRELAALAIDMRIGKDSLLQAEVEHSRRSQASVPGLSLLGNALPSADPSINLGNQPWALPVVLQGLSGSVRFEQNLGNNWGWNAQWATQRLKSDDRSAFPFGCSDSNGIDYYADRYCPNGDVDLYDFRSENEQRSTQAVQLQVKGKLNAGGVRHSLGLGVLTSNHTERFGLQAYNYLGTSNIGKLQTFAPAPAQLDPNTNRNERSTELSAFDAIEWTPGFSTWLGLRNTHLQRSSVRTNASRPTDYNTSITTPWLAASWQITPSTMAYASWGQGVESQVVPNKPSQYSNAGLALPSLKSRQTEWGLKTNQGALSGSLVAFNIHRPATNLDACSRLSITPCQGDYDGSAVHTGLEANTQWTTSNWNLSGGATLLKARREGSLAEPQINGQRPTNVPRFIARLNGAYQFAGVPGLSANAHLSHEGSRNVLPDGSVTLPAWTRVDAGLNYATTLAGTPITWGLAIDNLLNAQFFKEAPYQFGHVYLFSQPARSLRLSLNAKL